jgi:hypothetical protein
MVRDEKETAEKVLFTGREAGLSFEKLDEKMIHLDTGSGGSLSGDT